MNATILAVDDDPLELKPLATLIASWGYDVITASTGADALKILAKRSIDVIVSDVSMPAMSGEELLVNVQKEYPRTPLIFLTGKGDIKSAMRAVRAGAMGYVAKPPDEEELQLSIRRAIEHSRIRRENDCLRAELGIAGRYGERLLGRSPEMIRVFELVNQVAPTDSTVLITGETGTGKELVAQTIHFRSRRSSAPLVGFNCAALNANLVESELFGHEKGAFTGAVSARRGRFEEANGGTLFLDEIGETTSEFQAKLLRVLQEKTFERVGGNEKVQADVRLIASTNRDLRELVRTGKFREDLFYRLHVIPIEVPPLRSRREDIVPLAEHFMQTFSGRYGMATRSLSSGAKDFLLEQSWKGNVRELEHAVERAVVLSRTQTLERADFAAIDGTAGQTRSTHDQLDRYLDDCTKAHILAILERTQWKKQEAADALGINRVTLFRLLKRFGMEDGG